MDPYEPISREGGKESLQSLLGVGGMHFEVQ